MKKLFIASMVLAGTAMGFAKDNGQVVRKSNNKKNTILHKKTIEDDCSFVGIVVKQKKDSNGNVSYELVTMSSCTYPCAPMETPGTKAVMIIVQN